ncbi:MAG: GGDEF domain-containing protein [Candidatus Nanopelagicales bacterium]
MRSLLFGSQNGETRRDGTRKLTLTAAVSTSEFKAFRRQTAKNEAPWVAASVSCIALILGLANSFIGPDSSPTQNIPVFIATAMLALSVPLFLRPQLPASAVPWIGAALAVILVGSLQIQEYVNWSSTGLVYSLFTIAAYGPIALDFVVAGVAAIPMAVGCVLVSLHLHSHATSDWIVASFAAFFISTVLLWARLHGVDDLARALALQESLATEDPLTGMLNRRGVEARIVQLFALGARQHSFVSALFVDIDGLKRVNDVYGHHEGDRVISATAVAIHAVVRADDLACRWGGDEFLILGLSNYWDPDAFSMRIGKQLATSGIPEELWRAAVSTGAATVDPKTSTFNELLRLADADMYARRAVRGTRQPPED